MQREGHRVRVGNLRCNKQKKNRVGVEVVRCNKDFDIGVISCNKELHRVRVINCSKGRGIVQR